MDLFLMKKRKFRLTTIPFYLIFNSDNGQSLQSLKFVMVLILETTMKEDLTVWCQLVQIHSENRLKFKAIRMNWIIDQLKIIMAYRVDMAANMMRPVVRSQLLAYLLIVVMKVRSLIIIVLLISNKICYKIAEAITHKNFNSDKDVNLKLYSKKDNFQ